MGPSEGVLYNTGVVYLCIERESTNHIINWPGSLRKIETAPIDGGDPLEFDDRWSYITLSHSASSLSTKSPHHGLGSGAEAEASTQQKL